MPLTAKGEEIKSALTKEFYGEKKGESVLYAGENKGTFTGIHADADPVAQRGMRLDACMAGLADVAKRMDAYCARTDSDRTAHLHGRNIDNVVAKMESLERVPK